MNSSNFSNSKTPIINLKTLKIFYLLNMLVPTKLEQNSHYQLLTDYNKIKEEEYLLEKKSNDKKNIDEEVSEKPKTKRKYTKKTTKVIKD